MRPGRRLQKSGWQFPQHLTHDDVATLNYEDQAEQAFVAAQIEFGFTPHYASIA